jgi:ATP-dependent 26S proteasome regulatory subunit
MKLTSKVVRVLSGGFLLFLGLLSMPQVGDIASAADEMKGSPCEIPHGQNAMRAEQAEMQGTHMISGEVIRVEDANYFVKEQSGKEVSVQTDQRTEKPEINQGDRISAYVDDQNHAVWIRSNKMTDRRTEHASADCVPN